MFYRMRNINFFLTASTEERARRRWKELLARGEKISFEKVLKDIEMRDYNDSTRELNPLRRAEDAVEIDSTSMSVEDVVKDICDRIV